MNFARFPETFDYKQVSGNFQKPIPYLLRLYDETKQNHGNDNLHLTTHEKKKQTVN